MPLPNNLSDNKPCSRLKSNATKDAQGVGMVD